MRKICLDFLSKPVAVVALGTDGFGVGRSEALAEELMDAYVAAGGNLLDSARMYGRPEAGEYGICEAVVGRWMERRRNRAQLVLSTKGGYPAVNGARRLDRTSLLSDLSDSLTALRTDFIDLYWLHRDDPERPVGDVVESINALLETGHVGGIGASNWSAARIREANAYAHLHGLRGFVGNQPQWSLARQAVNPDPTLQIMDADTYALHREQGLVCMPFSAQAKGYFSKLLSFGEQGLSPKARARFHVPENVDIAHRLAELCGRCGCSPAALSVAWLTNQPFPTIPVVSASSAPQLLDPLGAGDVELTQDEVRWLRAMD